MRMVAWELQKNNHAGNCRDGCGSYRIRECRWIAILLWVLAAFLIAWGLQPKSTEAFLGRVPYDNYILRALTKLDTMLSGRR